MAMGQYQYQPLKDPDTTRILVLEAGKRDEPLVGSLEVVSIGSAGEYEALSYVWADPGPLGIAYNIQIRNDDDEGSWCLVLRGGSIFAPLQGLRLSEQPRRIWADQCCINQDDLLERSRQVQFMNQIYQDAAHVLVWLGLDPQNEAALAFAFVRELEKVFRDQLSGSATQRDDEEGLRLHVEENRKSVQALNNRAYFKRGWVVQEIGTSTPATIFWGNAVIEWSMLANVCERLKCYYQCRSILGITTSDVSFMFQRFIEPNENTHHVNRFNFVYELQRARHLRFTDPRDRIFAFIGHYSLCSIHPLGIGPMSITVDYTKSVEQTYIDLAVRMLQTNPAATSILLAAVQHPVGTLPPSNITVARTKVDIEAWTKKTLELPSWVPDWRQSWGIILAEPICPHYAHGTSVAKIELLNECSPILQIHGIEVDTIRKVSCLLKSNDFYQTKTSGQDTTVIEQLWHGICGRSRFNLEDKYLDGQASLFAFMQTLSNGCVQAAGHDGRVYHDIPNEIWLREAARYIMRTQMPSEILSDILVAAGDVHSNSELEQWSRWATSASDGRTFAKSETGYYVLGPAPLEAGDVVCVLFGCKVPFCLRPSGDRYLLVGECYAHGLMKGEVMNTMAEGEKGVFQKRVFNII